MTSANFDAMFKYLSEMFSLTGIFLCLNLTASVMTLLICCVMFFKIIKEDK